MAVNSNGKPVNSYKTRLTKFIKSTPMKLTDTLLISSLVSKNFQIKRSYFNLSNYRLKVIERSGIFYSLDPCTKKTHQLSNHTFNSLVIIDSYSIEISVAKNHYEEIKREMELGVDEYYDYDDNKVFKQEFTEAYKEAESKGRSNVCFDIQHIVKPKELIDENNQVNGYITNHDIFVTDEFDRQIIHPFSSIKQINEFVDNLSKTNSCLTLSLDIVDNENKIGSRFINFAGQIKKIVPRKDINLGDGVRVIHYNNGVPNKSGQFCATLEDAEGILLFKSHEEAVASGDISLANKLELEKLKKENADILLALEKDKLTYEKKLAREKSKLEEEMRAWDREKLKYEKTKQKKEGKHQNKERRYKERTMDKNDTKETIKLVCAIVSATVVIFTALNKNK